MNLFFRLFVYQCGSLYCTVLMFPIYFIVIFEILGMQFANLPVRFVQLINFSQLINLVQKRNDVMKINKFN